MDGGDEHEKEKKRVKDGLVTASHLLDLISFRPHNSLPKQPYCYACFTDEEPEAYSLSYLYPASPPCVWLRLGTKGCSLFLFCKESAAGCVLC